MDEELGGGNNKPEALPKLAQYELTLLGWIEDHKGCRKYVAIAGKCWLAFWMQLGFVPCYVNSRLTYMGIPVSCEVDIYGCLSEFIGTCVRNDAFMGFHCENTTTKKLSSCSTKYQMIMVRTLPKEVPQGTLEGDIV